MKNNKFIQSCLAACEAWGIIPTSFAQSMTWEEQVLWLSKFLQTQVIPVVNGHTEAIKAIEHWLDNLDLQDEVDTKLDEMAESGELTDIIAQYLDLAGVLAYDTIAAMAAAENLADGSIARVLGNTAATDGDGAYYKVRTVTSGDVIDGVEIVALAASDTLVAQRIHDAPFEKYVSDSVLNVKYAGAKGDGVTDDYQVLQDLIDNNPLTTLYFPKGTYLISQALVTPAPNAQRVFLQLDHNAVIKADSAFTDNFAIVFGGNGAGSSFGNSYNKTGIDGGTIDCNSVCGAINVQKTMMTKISNLTIINGVKNGIQIDQPADLGLSSDAHISKVNIFGAEDDVEGRTGIVLNGYDNTIEEIRMCGYHMGLNINSGGNILSDVHPLFGYDNSNTYNTTVGFRIAGNDNFFTNCYSDNFSTAFYFQGTYRCNFSNTYIMWFSDNAAHQHYAIRCTGANLISKFSNLDITFPSTGINKGIVIDGGTYPSIYYNGSLNGLRIENLSIEWDKLTNKLSDPILMNKISGDGFQTFGGMADGNALTYWYPLLVFHDMQCAQELKVNIGNNIIFDVSLSMPNDGTLSFKASNVVTNNGSKIKLGVGQLSTNELDNVYVLYFSITARGTGSTNNWSRTTQLLAEALGTRAIILPRDAIYRVTELNGVASIPNSLGEYTLVA